MIEHLCCCIVLITIGDIQILTVCLLQSQTPVRFASASYTPNLLPVPTYHFLLSKSNSCSHLSLPTLQIYLLYSHITSYAPNPPPVLTYHFLYSKCIVPPTLTCFHPKLKMAIYSLLFETDISLRVFLTEIVTFLYTYPI
jgi:hypothetical protein